MTDHQEEITITVEPACGTLGSAPSATSYFDAYFAFIFAFACSATKRPSGIACPSTRHCAPSLNVSGKGQSLDEFKQHRQLEPDGMLSCSTWM